MWMTVILPGCHLSPLCVCVCGVRGVQQVPQLWWRAGWEAAGSRLTILGEDDVPEAGTGGWWQKLCSPVRRPGGEIFTDKSHVAAPLIGEYNLVNTHMILLQALLTQIWCGKLSVENPVWRVMVCMLFFPLIYTGFLVFRSVSFRYNKMKILSAFFV